MPPGKGVQLRMNIAAPVILERSEESQGGGCANLLLSVSVADIKIAYNFLPLPEILRHPDNS